MLVNTVTQKQSTRPILSNNVTVKLKKVTNSFNTIIKHRQLE